MIKNNKFRGLAAAAAVAALFTAQPAAADVIDLTGWWASSEEVLITSAPGVSNDFSTWAGGFTTVNQTTGNTFQSFCVDIFDHFNFAVSSNSTSVPAAVVIGTQAATDLGRLYSNYHNEIAVHGDNSVNEAAFQLAVWEIVYENDPNAGYALGNGGFAAQGWNGETSYNAVTIANSWLASLSTPSVSAYNATIWGVDNMITVGHGYAQDVVTFTPVPEPETYAMMLVGLGLLGFSARRKSQF